MTMPTIESNPEGPASGNNQVIRGASWYEFEANVRAAARLSLDPRDSGYGDVGFRCAR